RRRAEEALSKQASERSELRQREERGSNAVSELPQLPLDGLQRPLRRAARELPPLRESAREGEPSVQVDGAPAPCRTRGRCDHRGRPRRAAARLSDRASAPRGG